MSENQELELKTMTGVAVQVADTDKPKANNGAGNSQRVPVWEFEGKKYPLFIANCEDSIGVPIKRNRDDQDHIGILVANFRWGDKENKSERSAPFRNRLQLEWKKVIDTKENLAEQQRANLDRKNAELFDAICIGGAWIATVDGEDQPPVELSPEKMRARTTEIKSNMISEWITSFHIERYFKGGIDEFEALTSGDVEQVYFKCSIGDVKEPNHVLILGFLPPSDDARREYDDKRVKNETKSEGNSEIIYTEIDNARKLRYAKKYLHSVAGAGIENDSSEICPVENDADLREFKDSFNPDWLFRLADALQDSFDVGGK